MALGIVLMLISLVVNVAANLLQQRLWLILAVLKKHITDKMF
jgi:hypothetical protein